MNIKGKIVNNSSLSEEAIIHSSLYILVLSVQKI